MGNPVSLSDLEAALDNLILEEAPPLLEDGEITVMRLAERANCGPAKATRMIQDWTEAGKVEYLGMRRVPRGHKVKAWRILKA